MFLHHIEITEKNKHCIRITWPHASKSFSVSNGFTWRCGPALFLGNIDGTGGEDAAMKQAGCYKRMSVMFTSCVMYIYICFLFIHCIIVNQSKTFAAEFNYS